MIVDLAKFDTPHGKQELANELKDAVRRWGFWTVVGTGISQDQLDRQLDIGNTFFKLPLAEKQKVSCNFQEGKYVYHVSTADSDMVLIFVSLTSYFGYREPRRFVGNSDVKENMEMVAAESYPDCARADVLCDRS